MNALIQNDLISQIKKHIEKNQSFLDQEYIEMEKRKQIFDKINNTRIRIALENFSEDMKFALFEVMFFLHVNSERFSTYKFQIFGENEEKKHPEEKSHEACDLYVPGAPYGVSGMNPLDPLINNDFVEYCNQQFGLKSIPNFRNNSILSICSIGSVGTIAHKPDRSDLDIQVQYDLFPADIPEAYLSHSRLYELLMTVDKVIKGEDPVSGKLKLSDLANNNLLSNYVQTHFKALLRYFISYQSGNSTELSPGIINRLILEIENLYRTHEVITKKKELSTKELLIQKKIKLIQTHISKKFPRSEIYFFAYTTDNYKRGQHGTTKKSKEASGTAYELILNYETLLPGIHFNNTIPSHFLFKNSLNSNTPNYKYMISLMRSGVSKSLGNFKNKYVDLGNTPYINKKYVINHFGAVYWEAFKASQGNLAKALLNLLRIEVMMWRDEAPSIINCIKDRSLYCPPKKKAGVDEFGLKMPANKMFSQNDIADAEEKFPNLSYDPWWIRYKILKYSYENPPGIIAPVESNKILRMIDICFAIHIYLAEIIDEEMLQEKKMEVNYRNNFLTFFYNNAFPLFSNIREKINRIFSGDIDEVQSLEKDMKEVFFNGIRRVEFHSKINSNQFSSNREEFQIWFHYFKKYFNPPHDMVQTSILQNIKQRRNRLVIKYQDKQWCYYSIYENEIKKNVPAAITDKQGKVELFRHHSFMHGFAYCILNNYYRGTMKSSIKKVMTTVDINFSKYNEQKDKIISRLPQDGVDRIGHFILEKFVKFPVNYRDALKTEKTIYDLGVFVNLMIFGRVDILYRDTLNNWYSTGITIDSIRGKSKNYFENPDLFLNDSELLQYIYKFCAYYKMNFSNIMSRIYFWINPTSLSAQGSTENRLRTFDTGLKNNFNKYVQSQIENKGRSD